MTKTELIELIADAAGVSPTDIKVLKIDYNTGSLRIEIDNLEVDPDEDEEDDDSEDLNDADE